MEPVLKEMEAGTSTGLEQALALNEYLARSFGFMAGMAGLSNLTLPAYLIQDFQSTFTFWRFLIKVPLVQHEMAIRYSVNNGQQIQFWVPGRMQNMRWATHSVRTPIRGSLCFLLTAHPV